MYKWFVILPVNGPPVERLPLKVPYSPNKHFLLQAPMQRILPVRSLPVSERRVEDKHAALALIDLAKQSPGELELIAIGPLTNLALALRLEPNLPDYFSRLVIMGGAYLGQGNTKNPPAEFNIFADPDAAFVVFSCWPKLTMVSWEATIDHSLPIADFRAFFNFDNQRSRFIEKVTKNMLTFIQKEMNLSYTFAADPLAMAVLLEPDIIVEAEEKYMMVERYGQLSRGMTVVDWYGYSQKAPNTTIVKKVNHARFVELFRSIFE